MRLIRKLLKYVLVSGGVCFVCYSIYSVVEYSRFSESALKLKATVKDIVDWTEVRGSNPGVTSRLSAAGGNLGGSRKVTFQKIELEYGIPDGSRKTGHMDYMQGLAMGDEIDILVDPNKPENFRLPKDLSSLLFSFVPVFSLALILFLLGGLLT